MRSPFGVCTSGRRKRSVEMAGDVLGLVGRGTLLVLCILVCVRSINGFIYGAPPDSCGNPVTFHTEALNETHVGQFLAQNASSSRYKLVVGKSSYNNKTMGAIKQSDVIRGK